MALLQKNRAYDLRHVDPDTGYGLLHSRAQEDCLFLNAAATALWKVPSELVDPERESKLFGECVRFEGADEYLRSVIAEMQNKGLFYPLGDAPPRADIAPAQRTYPLRQLYFYVTRDCNARCYHCYQPTNRDHGGPRPAQAHEVGVDACLQLVERAVPLGLAHVKITGGEPFLRAEIGDLIRGVRRLGVNLSIETNGFYIDESMADLLSDEGVDVSISIDAGSARLHDQLRGLSGSFERATAALTMLARRELDPKVIMSVSRRNVDEVEGVIRTATSCGCRLIKLNPVNTLGVAQRLTRGGVLLSVEQILELHGRRRALESRHGVFLFLEGPIAFTSIYEITSGHAAVCPFTGILGVLADGSLSYCGVGNSFPELLLGRIDDQGFDIQEFWQRTEALRQVRAQLTERVEGVCARCLLEPYCKGSCRALAYGEYGRFTAPHPWCQGAFEKGLFPAHYLKPEEGGVESPS